MTAIRIDIMMMQPSTLSLLLLILCTVLSQCQGVVITEKLPHESAEQFVQRIVENSDVSGTCGISARRSYACTAGGIFYL